MQSLSLKLNLSHTKNFYTWAARLTHHSCSTPELSSYTTVSRPNTHLLAQPLQGDDLQNYLCDSLVRLSLKILSFFLNSSLLLVLLLFVFWCFVTMLFALLLLALSHLPVWTVGARVMYFALNCFVFWVSVGRPPTWLKLLYIYNILNKPEVQINRQKVKRICTLLLWFWVIVFIDIEASLAVSKRYYNHTLTFQRCDSSQKKCSIGLLKIWLLWFSEGVRCQDKKSQIHLEALSRLCAALCESRFSQDLWAQYKKTPTGLVSRTDNAIVRSKS